MSIDLDGILQELINQARDALDGQLSEIGPVGNTFPAVIKVRNIGVTPEYPYVTIDCLDISDGGEWLVQECIDQNTGELSYESYKNLLINFRVYGGNALNIANNLHGWFRINKILTDIREATSGAVISTGSVDSLPQLLSTGYIESASFNMIFGAQDIYVVPDTDSTNYFDSIEHNGELYRGEDDPSPLPINVNAP